MEDSIPSHLCINMVDMLLSRVEEPVMQDDSPVPLPERTDGVLCLESA